VPGRRCAYPDLAVVAISQSAATELDMRTRSPTTTSVRWTSGPITEPAPTMCALEDRARKQAYVDLEVDHRVDVRRRRIDHRDAGPHPFEVDAGAQLGLGVGELGPVVHAQRLHRVVGLDTDHRVTRLAKHRDHVGEVVLALRVLGTEPPECGREQPPAEAVDRRIDLVDLALFWCRVGVLDGAATPSLSRTTRPSPNGSSTTAVRMAAAASCRRCSVPSLAMVSARTSGVAREHEDVVLGIELVERVSATLTASPVPHARVARRSRRATR
jgi:hypothetical protein